MPHQALPYTVRQRRGSPCYQGKIEGWKNYRSAGETTKAKAMNVVMQWYEESFVEETITFGAYADRFYNDGCPHCSRPTGDGRSASFEHISAHRSLIDKYF